MEIESKGRHAYPDEAVVEMQPDEAGGDAGVVGEGVGHRLPDQGLGVGAARVVEPHLQLALGHRRQLEAQQSDGGRHGRRRHCRRAISHSFTCNRRHGDNVTYASLARASWATSLSRS